MNFHYDSKHVDYFKIIKEIYEKFPRAILFIIICGALRDLVPLVRFKKRERFLNYTSGTKSRNAPHISLQYLKKSY